MTKKKNIIWYCVASLSALGLGCCILLLFPGVRNIIIGFAETFVFHQSLENRYVIEAHEALALVARFAILFIIFIDFWVLTRPGKYLLDKIGFVDIKESNISDRLKSFFRTVSERRFEIFALFSGLFIFFVACSRSVNAGITTDEANTYLDVVRPNMIEAILRSQALNNHWLNTILIRMVYFLTQANYNEFFIRLPNLVFYIVYILFAFNIARKSNHRYFVFILCITNYYLNEFFSLGRGYGISAACILGAFYYFDMLRNDIENKSLTHKFLFWCSLAALANGISLYTIFCFMVILLFKYRVKIIKLSYLVYFLVFAFSAVYVIIMSRPGQSLASTGNFYECIISAVFDTFSLYNPAISLVIFGLFLGIIAVTLIKTRFKNDYCLMYILFIGIALAGNILFHRGYPLQREMIPFYPLVLFVIIESLSYLKSNMIVRYLLTVTGLLLCFQFILQIDIRRTRDWNSAYAIRDAVYGYAVDNPVKDRNGLQTLVDQYGVVGRFYVEKIGLFFNQSRME